jgi:succinate-acetate transporter protein
MLTLSLIWGILAFLVMLVGFLPCLGSLNWLNIPFSAVGLVLGVIAVTQSKELQKGGGIAGIVLCAVGVVLGLLRLLAGGGIF